MAKLGNKHLNVQTLAFNDFSGGINLTKPAETLANNEMQEATNFEFSTDSGALKVRGGVNAVLQTPADIMDIFPVVGTDTALLRLTTGLYLLEGRQLTLLGPVKGDAVGSFEYWGEHSGVVMAFGGSLYTYNADTKNLQEVVSEGAPEAVVSVFYRAGRVAVVEATSDVIRYSGIGDPTQWVNDPEDASTSQSVEVGYMDGCDIQAVGALASDLVVFKAPVGQPEHGRVYRLAGEFPNWSVTLLKLGTSAWGSRAVANLNNDLLYITKEGLASMGTGLYAGDYKMSWPGNKVNTRVARTLTGNCRLWVLPTRGQVWFWDGASQDVWIYHYQIGQGAWTRFLFPGIISGVASVSGRLLICSGNVVYQLDDGNSTDYVMQANGNVTQVPLSAVWIPMTIIRRNQLLAKMIVASYLSSSSAGAVLNIEGLQIALPATDRGFGDVASEDTDIAYLDTDPLVSNRASVVRQRCQIVRWDITPRLEVMNGVFQLSTISLEVAEV